MCSEVEKVAVTREWRSRGDLRYQKSANAENLLSVRIESQVYHLHNQSARDIQI
jgi:hypothetical protein